MSTAANQHDVEKTRALHILQVITVVASDYGGPSIGSVALNIALRELGHDAMILTTTIRPDGSALTSDEVAALETRGARVRAFSASWPRRLHNSWRLARSIMREARHADVIHMHGQYLAPHLVAYLAARRARIPFGLQPHGGLEPYQRSQSRLKKFMYNALVGSRVLREAAYVQFASESEARNASDVVRVDQVRVAPLGASLDPPRPSLVISDWLGGSDRSEVVVFLGRLARKKRPDVLLRLWKDVASAYPRARLIIAGPDDDFSGEDLRQLAHESGVSDSVLIAGPVLGQEKAWLLESAAIFVLPSENENFGVSVAEAMLGGCAIVVTDRVAAAEHVLTSGGGRVVDTHEGFLEAVGSLLGDVETARAMGQRAREYSVGKLTWTALAASVANAARAAVDATTVSSSASVTRRRGRG